MAAIELYSTSLFADADLQAYYRLEDVTDSKNDYDLTNTGSVAFNAAKFNNGGDLGASNSSKYLSVASNLGIAGNGDLTISLWLKLQTEIASGIQYFWLWGSTTTDNRYMGLIYDYNGGTRQLKADNGGAQVGAFNATLGTSTTHHIVVTKDETGNSIHIWLNGVDSGNGVVGTAEGGVNKLDLGKNNGGGGYTSGIFDDVAVFNRVLTDTEIGNLYNGTWPSGNFFALL